MQGVSSDDCICVSLTVHSTEMDSVVMAVSRSSLEEHLKSLKEVDIAPCDVQWSGRMSAACSSVGELWIGKWQGQLVALKKIKGGCKDSAAEAKLRKEARMMMKLASPHIVRVHGFLSKPTAIVMQLMRCSLGSLLRSRSQLPWRAKVTCHTCHVSDISLDMQIRITIQIICGLQFIHSQGVLHRDLKSDNVLLDCSGALLLRPLHASAADADSLCMHSFPI